MTSKVPALVKELQGSQLFGGISEALLQPIVRLCRQVTLDKGEPIFEQGGPARHIYVVRRGRVALEMSLERPDGSLTHTTVVEGVGPGDAFGWSALVEPYVLTLSAKAVERCELIALEAPRLREALNQYRDTGYLVMVNAAKLLADRLMQTREAFVYERDWLFDEKRGSHAVQRRERQT